jgi:hypothetical protein
MSRSPKVNYGKWSVILGIPIALLGSIAAVVAVPDIGCRVGFNLPSCAVPLKEVELFTQAETGEFLPGVKIQFMAKGAPEVQYTDNNGYAKVQMPSRGDVRVNLNKAGYPVQEFTINLENPQPPVRLIRFSQSGQPKVEQVESTPVPAPPVSSPSSTTLPPSSPPTNSPTTTSTQSNEDIFFQLKGCRRENETLKCEFFVTDQSQDRTLYMYAKSSNSSRIIDPQGNQYVAKSVDFGGTESSAYVYQNLVQGIGLKAFITFEKVPIQINQLALVEVSARTQSQGSFTIQFRDVPVSN